MRKFLFGMFSCGVLILFAVLIKNASDHPPTPSPAPIVDGAAVKAEERPAPLPTISIAMLQRIYDQNEVSADQRYKGQRMELYGAVTQIRKTFTGQAVLDIRTGAYKEAQAYLSDTEESKAAQVQRGMAVAMQCVVAGVMIGDLQLNDCIIEDNPKIEPSQAELQDLSPMQWEQLGHVIRYASPAPEPAAENEPDSQPERQEPQ